MDRNYHQALRKKKQDEENLKNQPIHLSSETGFVPIIDERSKKITSDRENEDKDEVYKNLYQDSQFIKDKKEAMAEEREKERKKKEDEEHTFQPSTAPSSQYSFHKFINPKKYLNLIEDSTYSEIHYKENKETNKIKNMKQPQVLHESISER